MLILIRAAIADWFAIDNLNDSFDVTVSYKSSDLINKYRYLDHAGMSLGNCASNVIINNDSEKNCI